VNETERLIASDKVEGTSVYDRNGNSLGSVYNFMVDKVSGKVAYAVMSFGGFLGIGERYHPLPWKTLTYEPRYGGYVVDITREQLERAPSYGASDSPWSDPQLRTQRLRLLQRALVHVAEPGLTARRARPRPGPPHERLVVLPGPLPRWGNLRLRLRRLLGISFSNSPQIR
jgi:hypothetical protein